MIAAEFDDLQASTKGPFSTVSSWCNEIVSYEGHGQAKLKKVVPTVLISLT